MVLANSVRESQALRRNSQLQHKHNFLAVNKIFQVINCEKEGDDRPNHRRRKAASLGSEKSCAKKH